jgi:hypothetical protein
MEADTVIRELPKKDQGYKRQLVANNIGKLINKIEIMRVEKGNRNTLKETHI